MDLETAVLKALPFLFLLLGLLETQLGGLRDYPVESAIARNLAGSS